MYSSSSDCETERNKNCTNIAERNYIANILRLNPNDTQSSDTIGHEPHATQRARRQRDGIVLSGIGLNRTTRNRTCATVLGQSCPPPACTGPWVASHHDGARAIVPAPACTGPWVASHHHARTITDIDLAAPADLGAQHMGTDVSERAAQSGVARGGIRAVWVWAACKQSKGSTRACTADLAALTTCSRSSTCCSRPANHLQHVCSMCVARV